MAINLAALISHPIQYQVPLFRCIAEKDGVNLTVYFCDPRGVEVREDPGFGEKIAWDIPLLKGYEYEFLPNHAFASDTGSFTGCINPGIVDRVVRRDYDALWIHGYASMTNWLAFVTAGLTNVPVILRGESTLQDPPPVIFRTAKRVTLRALFRSIDAFAAIGTRNREFYRSYGIPEQNLFDAPYTVHNEFFQRWEAELPTAEQLRREEALPPDRPVVLFVGKLIERKRPGLLFEAFDAATDPGEATLIYVGEGLRREALERRVNQCGRAADVIFTGFQNQSRLPRYYKLADLFVLPSAQENWGLVINEAMNFGLPVISTDAVGASADLVDERNGCVVPSDDREALAAALGATLSDAEKRARMGNRSRERIEDWNIEASANGIIDAARSVSTERGM